MIFVRSRKRLQILETIAGTFPLSFLHKAFPPLTDLPYLYSRNQETQRLQSQMSKRTGKGFHEQKESKQLLIIQSII